MKYVVFSLFLLCFFSCDSKVPSIIPSGNNEIDDLPFSKVEDGKAYADLILRALSTNRKQPIYDQMIDRNDINVLDFNRWISMYSTGITGRKDWEFRDIYEENDRKKKGEGYDYAWLDPKGRLGLQVNILPIKTDNGYKVKKMEFRSRLEIMESIAIPGGEIEDYKKLNYNWDKE
ncbi:MAG: hypothetical protein ACI9FN_002511 [Saprospiraceae bacterium]|jgi:hypothetical protein